MNTTRRTLFKLAALPAVALAAPAIITKPARAAESASR